jgi:prepilin-type N-terminal cleavage/methylation domain-containing protein
MTLGRTLRSQSGYSLIELLISTAIMLVVTGAIFGLVNPSQGTAKVQPEVADMQQRLRVASDTLFRELMMVGAGVYQGPVTGSLINFFAPVLPRRIGDDDDAPDVFLDDTITVAYIPNTYSQTTISSPMPPNSNELKVFDQPHCPKGQELCGFKEGMEVIIFDTAGNFDTFVITKVQDSAGHLQHKGKDLNYKYETGAQVTQINSFSYYRDAATNRLMRVDGANEAVAIAENVVGLQFSYFGDPAPPRSPKPPAGKANCLYDAAGNYIELPTLDATDGSLAALTAEMLTDGPFCGSGANAFDADLLRVRKVRVALRVQVADSSLRGTDNTLWINPGKSRASDTVVRDLAVSFEVTPRNLNLAR